MKELEEKYINLLLTKCLNFKKSKSILISYNTLNKDIVSKIVEKLHSMDINDIYLDEEDSDITKNKLINESLIEIKNDSYFDKSIWNEYALKNASFLMLETELPGFYDEVELEKIVLAKKINRETRKIFREKESKNEIPWTIAALPNELWAKDLFPNEKNKYEKLYSIILKLCMVDENDPIKNWEQHLNKQLLQIKKLNNIKIKKLHYKNNLGTNLTITMPKDYSWSSIALDEDMIVNMPSYEIFSAPDYRYTEGIVYSAKPLVYGGGVINDFYVEFKNGKVINYDAKEGKELLKGIIESDSNSCYLGEVALVDYNSPISNTNIIFKTTLFDENASCHIALGDGISECLKNSRNMTKEELLEHGINQSTNHVDFMIGTSDLSIEAETEKGNIQIFKNGNFVI